MTRPDWLTRLLAPRTPPSTGMWPTTDTMPREMTALAKVYLDDKQRKEIER